MHPQIIFSVISLTAFVIILLITFAANFLISRQVGWSGVWNGIKEDRKFYLMLLAGELALLMLGILCIVFA